MIDIGVFYNGTIDLPLKEGKDGIVIPDGSLTDVHESCKRGIVAAVRQGVLADKLGFDYFWQTEHHFQIEGAEFSPNPVLSGMAIAAQTKRIRVGQATNVITMHHPVRLAEQIAMLDLVSGGRCEMGVGRGYQPREVEVLGRNFGATIQDQERNRAYFEEAYEVLIKCFTEASFQHRGENLSVPPSYTKWGHAQTMAYLEDGKAGRSLDDVLKVGRPDMYSSGNPVVATTTRMEEISVFPQALQSPHPQVWMPMTSDRTIQMGAQKGINGQFFAENNSRLKRNIEVYHAEAERCGWPDYRNRGEFKFGWDSEKRRGIAPGRWVHIEMGGLGDRKRWERGIQHGWDFYGPFGFAAVFAEAGEAPWPMSTRITPEIVQQKELGVCGPPDKVIEVLMRCKEACGYEDFNVMIDFEVGGFESQEVEDQMQAFAEEVMPTLRRECGGAPNLQDSKVEVVPQLRPQGWLDSAKAALVE
ncbi:MAG TPA: LLM class flavin-dependent oxidoreductase [Novosphingobium sp.]|nr:LLM class flavin-dependent oxidoreductase [Novosphingobium sp.]